MNFSRYFLYIISGFFGLSHCKQHTEFADQGHTYLLADSLLANYESRIDHAALIGRWSEEFYHRGMATYRQACFSCHGDPNTPGSIPNSRQFWSEPFKNGSDPYSIYQTLTRGHGLMPPQIKLTPQEKYSVIHFIREEFLKKNNPTQYFPVTKNWLESLPEGDTLGPSPVAYKPWAEMDYGDFLIHTYELANSTDQPRRISGGSSPLANEDYRQVNFSYKGIAIRLDAGSGGVAAGKAFVLFDHDLLRMSGFWTGEGFIDYEGILFNDEHNIYPRTVGQIQIANEVLPGWSEPGSGSWTDPRFQAVDGRKFGPLPRLWAHYKGLYRHGHQYVLQYTVGSAQVLETYTLETTNPLTVISRTINISASPHKLSLRIAPSHAGIALKVHERFLHRKNGYYFLNIPANQAIKIKIFLAPRPDPALERLARNSTPAQDLLILTQGGPSRDTVLLTSTILPGDTPGAYQVDVFTLPLENSYKSRIRPTGLDFDPTDGTAVLCTVDGEVWRISGITQKKGTISWKRIASGLFQPLGIKIHLGSIFVSCRDQIVRLHDYNGDGETDYYQSFNSDHQVTEHFHEFAMGLQVDSLGNFYYAKSGRHARTALVPQHGTLIKVSSDGMRSEILATGFRAANGVCLNPDGSFIVTDQEGYWNPMNRINWVEPGKFYGNMWGYGAPIDSSDTAMVMPLCWIDMKYDRSPAELLWAKSDRWGPLNGHLLNLSYGYGKIFVVLPQLIGTIRQGGMVELPVPQFPTGIMRGRFNPQDGQLYVCGMSAWATNQMLQTGGFYRVRYTAKALHLPVALKSTSQGLQITFSDPLDHRSATDTANLIIHTWDLKRSRKYGSPRLNEKTLTIDQSILSKDAKVLTLLISDLRPTWVMEILYQFKSKQGQPVHGAMQNTIYTLENNL